MALILILSLLVMVAAQPQEKSICVKMEGFDSSCSTDGATSGTVTAQGKPGKRGPIGGRGLKGAQGEKGEVGEADYDQVEEMISRRIERVLTEQAQKNSELSRRLDEANEIIQELKNRTNYCPVRYKGKCFWYEPGRRSMNCDRAREVCAAQGAKPANIYSQDHHDMLIGYMRTVAWQDGATTAWVGMTYNPNTRTVLLTDGSRAPYLKWYPGYPSSNNCCCTGLVSRWDWKSPSQHLHTYRSTNYRRGVICEK